MAPPNSNGGDEGGRWADPTTWGMRKQGIVFAVGAVALCVGGYLTARQRRASKKQVKSRSSRKKRRKAGGGGVPSSRADEATPAAPVRIVSVSKHRKAAGRTKSSVPQDLITPGELPSRAPGARSASASSPAANAASAGAAAAAAGAAAGAAAPSASHREDAKSAAVGSSGTSAVPVSLQATESSEQQSSQGSAAHPVPAQQHAQSQSAAVDGRPVEPPPMPEWERLKLEGNQFYKDQDHHMALQRYNSALKIKPDYVPCLFNRSTILLQQGLLDMVFQDTELALELEPQNFKMWHVRGRTFLKSASSSESTTSTQLEREHLQKAIECFQRSISFGLGGRLEAQSKDYIRQAEESLAKLNSVDDTGLLVADEEPVDAVEPAAAPAGVDADEQQQRPRDGEASPQHSFDDADESAEVVGNVDELAEAAGPASPVAVVAQDQGDGKGISGDTADGDDDSDNVDGTGEFAEALTPLEPQAA